MPSSTAVIKYSTAQYTTLQSCIGTHINRYRIFPYVLYSRVQVQNGLLTAFRNSAEICQVMIKSEQLKDAIQELNDVAGAATVRVKVHSAKGMMVRYTI